MREKIGFGVRFFVDYAARTERTRARLREIATKLNPLNITRVLKVQALTQVRMHNLLKVMRLPPGRVSERESMSKLKRMPKANSILLIREAKSRRRVT